MQLCVFFCERDNIDIRALLSQLEIMHTNVNELPIELVRLDRLSLTNFIRNYQANGDNLAKKLG